MAVRDGSGSLGEAPMKIFFLKIDAKPCVFNQSKKDRILQF